MPHDFKHDYHSIDLHSRIGFEQLFDYCRDKFGFVFLQDNDRPVMAFLPKTYRVFLPSYQVIHIKEKKQYIIKTYTRQESFLYQNSQSNSSEVLDFFPQIKPSMKNKDPIGFTGGYISFISYDMAAEQQEIHLQQHQKNNTASRSYKATAILGEYDIFLKFTGTHWRFHYHKSLTGNIHIAEILEAMSRHYYADNTHQFTLSKGFNPRWTKYTYTKAFTKIQSYLQTGDCYQVNLTQPFDSQLKTGQLLDLLPDLVNLSKAPFAGYISHRDFGDGHFELLSCSPELFLSFEEHRILKTRPIKGTMPRHEHPAIDEQLKIMLKNSEKDKAENLMIVDLLRNDLSIHAKVGSVKTPKLFEVETFEHIHHLVSEIEVELKNDYHLFEILFSALPGGSITGAPKIRAMQIIDEVEAGRRGAYCGTLGYLNYDGTGRFNVLIRSIQRHQQNIELWAGGGITVASDVNSEYDECLNKIDVLLNYFKQYEPH